MRQAVFFCALAMSHARARGGGNHFIEIDEAADGTKYLVIHSGSRNLGKQVAELYQSLAIDLNKGKEIYFQERDEIIRTYKEQLNLEEYRETMKGIYTTSVNESTLDEAPMAYKSLEDIIDVIRDSVDIIDVMKPIYNFKASD